MEEKRCQSCYMPMNKPEDFGKEADGSPSDDYCVHCYQDGDFTWKCTYEEAVEVYKVALIQCRIVKGISQEYIEARMKKARDYLEVHDLISLGDTYTDKKDWNNRNRRRGQLFG